MIFIKIIATAGYFFIGWIIYKWWIEPSSSSQTVVESQPAIPPQPAKRSTSDLDFELFLHSADMQIAVSKIGHKYQDDFMSALNRGDQKETAINLGKTQAIADITAYICEESKKYRRDTLKHK